MRVLIAPAGSHGDILPFVAIGREFQRRGHEVRFFANEIFAAAVEGAGLPFRSIGTAEEYLGFLKKPDLNHPLRSLKIIAEAMDEANPAIFDAFVAEIVPGESIIVNSALAFGARAVAEIYGIPCASIHLQPAVLRGGSDVTRADGFTAALRGVQGLLRRAVWYLADRLVIGPTIERAVNRRRVARALPPVDRPFHRWIHETDALVGLFPPWFALRERDWPAKLTLTGFPLYDGDADELPAALEAFLKSGEPPIAFTAGTATAASHAFFAESVEACRRSGRRGILLTHVAEQIPQNLPANVLHVSYVPFSALLPRVAAFVHHGGIGTLSQALRAGVPQLIRPMAHDQFDNAARAVALGVAIKIPARKYRAERVVKALERLMSDVPMRERCAQVAAKVTGDGVSAACTHILATLAPMHLRLITDEDWERWRNLRLAALRESPEAFCASLRDWEDADEARWRGRLREVPFNAIVEIDGAPAGMVSAETIAPDGVELLSLWVAPQARGRGIGDALVRAVIDWAAARGASHVELEAIVGNDPARELYRRSGFVAVGEVLQEPPPRQRYRRLM